MRSSTQLVVSCFNFKLLSFFPCRNLMPLIRLLTAIFIWCNKTLYTMTDKGVDHKMLMLRMSFCNLRFSRCLFCSSASINKRAIFLFSFRIDTLTLACVGISFSFLHNFINAMSSTNFSNFVFFCSKSLTTLIKSCPCFFLIGLKYYLGHTFL